MRTLAATSVRLAIIAAVTSAALATLTTATMGNAAAQSDAQEGAIRVGGGLVTGFAGELSLDFELDILDGDDNLIPAVGFDLFVEYVMMRYVALGARSSFVFWNSDDADRAGNGRSFVWAFSPYAKGRYPFEIAGFASEASLMLPLGLSVSRPNGDLGGAGEINTGVGFNLAILGGFTFFFTDTIGAYTHLGWQWHWVGHEENVSNTEFGAKLSQLRWLLGVTAVL